MSSSGISRSTLTRRTRLGNVRVGALLAMGTVVIGGALAMVAEATTPPAYAATASLSPALYYIGDSAGSLYTFTVTNTGTTTKIGAVEIDRPDATWTITACPTAPSGWAKQVASTKCRYRSANSTSDDILPGQSRTFVVKATTAAGNVNHAGVWPVVVSSSNQFDNPSLLKNAAPAGAGLSTTLYTFELTDAVVTDSTPGAGTACPAAHKDAVVGSTHNIVVCGKNHANAALTPNALNSSLGGSFIATPGVFTSGSIVHNSGNVVLADWVGTHVSGTYGTNKNVIAQIGSASNRTSPLRTFTGYSATSQPPVAHNDSYSTNEDTPLHVGAPGVLGNDTDPESDPITAGNASDPAHGSVTLNADGSFDYTPDANYNGPDSFTYTANDTHTDSPPATVNITVNSVNDAPVATDDNPSVSEDSTGDTVDVLANDTDADLDGLTITSVDTTGTTGVVTNNGDDVTYDPNGQFEYLTTGQTATDTFTYTISDGSGGTDTATVTVTITGVNDAPVATGDAYSTDEDTPLHVAAPGVLGNDTDAEGAVTAVLDVDAAHGDLTLNSDGSFDYTPDANYYGSDSFTYMAKDADDALSDPATVDITVNSVNDAPVATDDNPSVSEDSTGDTVDVLANDTDADLDGLTITSVDTTGTTGVVTNNGDDVTYDPNGQFEYLAAGETATDSFTYTISDGSGGTDTATVTVTITGVNDAPVANDDAGYQTIENTDLVVAAPGVLTNDTDADSSDTVTAGNASDPANGSVTLNLDGSFTYTPDTGYTGPDSFTYDASDGTATDTATVSITVVPPNATPTADATSASGNEDGGPITVTLTGHDADDDPLTFTAGTATNGTVGTPGSISCSAVNVCTATVTYTPNANYNGGDSFTYHVNDGTIDSADATATITVNPVNDAPSFTKGANQTVNEDAGAQTVTGWATAISSGPANESTQTVSFVTSTNNDPLFSSLPAVNAAGDLSYTPAVNANGSATVTIHAHDDGGTANGGVDNSANQTFTITVNAVNDVPSFTKGADQTKNEDDGPQSISNWATAISPGPSDESGQTVQFILTNDNAGLFSAAPAVSPTGTLTYTSAANKYGVANLTVKIKDNGGTANGGVDTSATQSFTITVNAVNDAPVAVAKAFSAETNMKINLTGLLAGATDTADTAQEPSYTPTYTLTDVTPNSCTGCVISNIQGTGSFDFEPPADGTGSYTLNYKIQDSGFPGPGVKSVDTAITVTVSGPVIHFVDATSGDDTTGNGTLFRPFKTLGKAATVDAASHRIFLYSGTYADGITLNTSEWLTGAGAIAGDFDSLMSISPPAGTIARPAVNGARPTVNGAVTLGSGNTLRGATLSGSTALSGTSFGTLTLSSGVSADVVLDSTGAALSLTTGTVAGDFVSTSSDAGTNNVLLSGVSTTGTSLGSGALAGATSDGFKVTSGTGTFTYSGTISNSSSGAAVSIGSKTGGSVTLSGAISDTSGAGVSLTSNTGATVNLTGGVVLSSGTSPAFVATGGGTVNVTGANNTITSTTGTPLNINGTTIGASGVTFKSIAANGAANGIVLNTTGSSGSLTVTGTASVADSGGIIQNTTGDAISLNSTQSPSFNWIKVSNAAHAGIQGAGVHGFTLTHSTLAGIGTAANDVNDSALAFNDTTGGTNNNLDGTVVITNNAISAVYGSGVDIFNYQGTIANATIDSNTLTSSTSPAAATGTAIRINLFGSASTVASMTKGSISSNTITNFPGGSGIKFQGAQTASSSAPAGTYGSSATPGAGTSMIAIVGNSVTGDATNKINGNAIEASVTGRGSGSFDIRNNTPITNMQAEGIAIGGAGAVNVQFNVTGNAVSGANTLNNDGIGLGIDKNIQADASTADGAVVKAIISNNTVSGQQGSGIHQLLRDSNANVELKMQNNNVSAPSSGGFASIRVDVGSSGNASFNPTFCGTISGNTAATGPDDGFGDQASGIVIVKRAPTNAAAYKFGITGLVGTTATAAETNLTTANPSSGIGAGSPYGGKKVTSLLSTSVYNSCTLSF
jgi:VCBS repeat-containing protein